MLESDTRKPFVEFSKNSPCHSFICQFTARGILLGRAAADRTRPGFPAQLDRLLHHSRQRALGSRHLPHSEAQGHSLHQMDSLS